MRANIGRLVKFFAIKRLKMTFSLPFFYYHRRAIVLSLQDSAQPVLCIDDEDDEEARFQADLARAIAASKVNASPTTSVASLSSGASPDPGNAPFTASAVASHASSSFLADRAQLEQQRLARLKRLRGESDSQSMMPPSKRRGLSRETSCRPTSEVGPSRKEKDTADQEAEVFWDGELRQTANMHVDAVHNGMDGKPVFRLSQIIGDVSLLRYSFATPLPMNRFQKSQIELAIISTYALQLSWIYTFFEPGTPVVLVTQPAPTEDGNTTVKEVLPNWIRVTPFLRGGRGVMHMKVVLDGHR